RIPPERAATPIPAPTPETTAHRRSSVRGDPSDRRRAHAPNRTVPPSCELTATFIAGARRERTPLKKCEVPNMMAAATPSSSPMDPHPFSHLPVDGHPAPLYQ